VPKPYVLPGSDGGDLRTLCKYCHEEREHDEVVTHHERCVVTHDSDLITEDDYRHYWQSDSYVIQDLWYCEYCEVMKDESEVTTSDTRIWVCPACNDHWSDYENAENCC